MWKYKGKDVKNLPRGSVGFLYLIITPEGKYYIGQTWQKTWRHYWGSGDALIAYYKKHGKKGVRRIILMFFDDVVALDKAEIHLCAKVDAKNNPKYYNLGDGGMANPHVAASSNAKRRATMTGRKHSAATKAKISATKKGVGTGRKGIPLPAHVKKAISIANTGKKHTAAAKAKISAATQGEKSSCAKLTTHQAQTIKHMENTIGLSQKDAQELADLFDVSLSTVNAVRNNINWKHLPDTIDF